MTTDSDPEWLMRLRSAALQRPRTQFQEIRWADLQQLLRERDFLLERSDNATRQTLAEMQRHHYGRGPASP